jgi:hypothetical protein
MRENIFKEKRIMALRHEATQQTTESALPLPDLVALLSEQHSTGSLLATLSWLPRSNKRQSGSYLALVQVEYGKVCVCTITERDTDNTILQGQAAFAALYDLEGITWQVTLADPVQQHAAHPGHGRHTDEMLHPQTDPLLFVSGSIPRRVRPPTREEQARLSRHHLNVLRLIDGQRTPQQIAQLFALTPEQLGTLLRDLLDATLILFYQR